MKRNSRFTKIFNTKTNNTKKAEPPISPTPDVCTHEEIESFSEFSFGAKIYRCLKCKTAYAISMKEVQSLRLVVDHRFIRNRLDEIIAGRQE